MSGVELRITGSDELAKKLRKFKKMGEAKNVVAKNTAEMQEKAKNFAPVDTGYLRRQIKMAIKASGHVGEVTSGAEYAIYQELGTRYQSGTPHMRPAFNEQSPKFIKDLKDLVGECSK